MHEMAGAVSTASLYPSQPHGVTELAGTLAKHKERLCPMAQPQLIIMVLSEPKICNPKNPINCQEVLSS